MNVRRNPITGAPVLFAPERGARPNAFGTATETICPFCPGNEALTPPESARVEGPDGWIVRVFPNKYPSADFHEVIVESPRHGATFGESDVVAVVKTWIDRYASMTGRDGVAHVALFRNEGTAAGASIPHIHSQIVAIPFIPPRIAAESAAFREARSCPLCSGREFTVIEENDTFRRLVPHGSAFPHQQWLVPRRHLHDLLSLDETEVHDMAMLLRSASAAIGSIIGAQNWMLMNFLRQPHAHFYADLVPRMASIAGFELQTGTHIQMIDPEETAARMRR